MKLRRVCLTRSKRSITQAAALRNTTTKNEGTKQLFCVEPLRCLHVKSDVAASRIRGGLSPTEISFSLCLVCFQQRFEMLLYLSCFSLAEYDLSDG